MDTSQPAPQILRKDLTVKYNKDVHSGRARDLIVGGGGGGGAGDGGHSY